MQPAVHQEDPTPDDLARPADALDRAAAEPEVDRRLALADGTRVAADEVGGWYRARDLEDPDVVVAVRRAPANVVERRRWIKPERRPDAVRDEGVNRRSLVDLVEVDDRPPRIELAPLAEGVHRRPVAVVKQ